MGLLKFEVDDFQLLLRPGSERFFLLNPTAAIIWDAYRAGHDLSACAEILRETYDLDPAQALRDVASTVEQWDAEGLLHAQSDPSRVPQDTPRPPAGLESTRYRLGDTAFSVAIGDPALREDLGPRIAHLAYAGPDAAGAHYEVASSGGAYAVYRDGALVDTTENLYAARTVLLFDVLRAAYAAEPWCANLHAGVIAQGDRCVIVAGASGAGKSTLSVAARLAGLDVLGDDAAPILERSGRVAATPLATMLREGSWALFEGLDRHYTLSEIFERETGRVRFLAPRECRLETREPSALLFVQREQDCTPRLAPLDTVEALQRFAETGFWVRPDQAGVEAFLDWLTRVPKFEAHYETTHDGVTLLRKALGG